MRVCIFSSIGCWLFIVVVMMLLGIFRGCLVRKVVEGLFIVIRFLLCILKMLSLFVCLKWFFMLCRRWNVFIVFRKMVVFMMCFMIFGFVIVLFLVMWLMSIVVVLVFFVVCVSMVVLLWICVMLLGVFLFFIVIVWMEFMMYSVGLCFLSSVVMCLVWVLWVICRLVVMFSWLVCR